MITILLDLDERGKCWSQVTMFAGYISAAASVSWLCYHRILQYSAVVTLVHSPSISMYSCCCCCCFSHSAHWLPTRKKLLYTVANPARGLLNREKKKKKKSGSAPPPPPPPPRAARSEKKKKIRKKKKKK